MDLPLLAALGALLCVCCSIEEGSAYTFRTFMGAEIATTAISSSAVVQRPCECRALCRDACVAVAIRRRLPSHFHCSFTEQKIAFTNDLVASTLDSRVFYKRQGCRTNFTLVDNVGCIYVSTVALNFTAAAASCPFDSQLFTANFLIDFNAMREYLLKNADSSSMNLWIGLNRTSNIETWKWFGSGTIQAPTPVGMVPGGTIPPSPYWGKNDPNENSDCAKILLKPTIGYFYHVADAQCSLEYKFLCKQI
ncbi:uncharacterized protein LOC125179053 [Hyalella azteca]|uniref:Uncharacterized protein LOC125179053 n=1 Tax=Hyalella azteca TaxID=294128 RepID=A0A979FSG8_HYAAZ|nr:uncharacterized protein LOC125179053 [Hyalella azteca]